ncbi:MAG: hypothetical protein EOP66_11890 [Sphingomonas sp.]|jgi:hypothetical protein|nr:MAG: hypothetical protein EOP66_11890 [Sphingomonas sp.]
MTMLTVSLAAPHIASACDHAPTPPPRMDCPDYPARVSVPSMRLSNALMHFRKIYRCGISTDASKIGDVAAGDLNSTRIRPQNSPLKVQPLKGGFSIHQ